MTDFVKDLVAYLRFEKLTKEERERLKERKAIRQVETETKRFFLTAWGGADSYIYKLRNTKNNVILFRIVDQPTTNGKQHCDYKVETVNAPQFTGLEVFAKDANKGIIYATGNPYNRAYFGDKGKKIENPFFHNQNDTYFFLINSTWETMEVFVLCNIDGMKAQICKMLFNGMFDDALNYIRKTAHKYNYD